MKDPQADEKIEIQTADELRTLLGPLDSNARLIRELHGVNVLSRDGSLRLLGQPEDVSRVRALVESALARIRGGSGLATGDMAQMIRGDRPAVTHSLHSRQDASSGTPTPRTPGQAVYWKALHEADVVLGVGPAGTGKTYLAVAAAVEAVKEGKVRRIVLVRPAVEAGANLGFLPGDFQAKVDPYLRPLHDALHDLLDPGQRLRYLESDLVEICPLAYMRGRTLNDAFVILDEAQNTTVPQMLMFLTRMGNGSRMVVTGDPSQVDLPDKIPSGLHDALSRLTGVEGVMISQLNNEDIVRHSVVQQIIEAYDRPDGQRR